jgi:hypothetical protein
MTAYAPQLNEGIVVLSRSRFASAHTCSGKRHKCQGTTLVVPTKFLYYRLLAAVVSLAKATRLAHTYRSVAKVTVTSGNRESERFKSATRGRFIP